ncbi:raffinose/stachyose/melibiose transport system substrate-binding protein [Actinoplanes lutulentus]|uniref:Carbohydrate ABC transporter substrate-binding protein (CUT1 family) n=1 Tax=Actinoplanes lutulentus TaxID=1287878 RepID=A0A327Z6S2_9ACTN|nr:extracellular solute-binding protein [Actinoplanes lutulentus]MBB2946336.1 raffinose/stachyose/melibiose transport system substrate-binding protein [Actinoplanes lutulentus]RAK28725.1 carbohydrate ABC transporter substrate-binding protein (CUT1 family) [Actinoplanes lutulentus]
MKRRDLLGLSVGAGAAAALAACGSSGPSNGGGGNTAGAATYWGLSGPPSEPLRRAAIDRFNAANPDTRIDALYFQNDAYKQKIKTSLGAGEGPSMVFNWGGGGLKTYVEAGQVDDLTDWFAQNAAVKDKIIPASFGAATVNGKIYARPVESMSPIVLFYNKKLFDQIGAQPPQTYGEILDLVPKFNAKGIAPFSLAGQSRWTNMMWVEFLLDRTAGSEVFDRVFAGEANAWSDPAVLNTLTKIQDLVRADGFIKGFSSITADSNADQALLYTGKAAMLLHGSWSYGIQKATGGDFVPSGALGYMNFPPVDGGKGDSSNVVGNPGLYLSISSKATDAQKDVAKKFFSTTLAEDAEFASWVGAGYVPVLKGTDAQFAAAPNADFIKFVSGTVSQAKVFAQSWDQALSPTAAENLLDNIAKLFQLQVSPQQWVDSMNGVIGK